MTFRTHLTALLALVLATSPLLSQTADQHTLLYKVSGKGIQPSYVFGTIHMLPQEDFELKPKVDSAFAACDKLVLELDMDDPMMFAQIQQGLPMLGDSTLKQLTTEAEYARIETALFDAVKMPLNQVDTYKPYLIASFFMGEFMGSSPASFENTLTQMALVQKKELLGLETVAEQMAVFDSIPYRNQVEQLLMFVDGNADMRDLYADIVKAYVQEDLPAINTLLRAEIDDPIEEEFLLNRRNHNWIPRMAELAAKESCFFAVGAGHLGGEQGVIALLREEGFEVVGVE